MRAEDEKRKNLDFSCSICDSLPNNEQYFVDPLDARFRGNIAMAAIEQPTVVVPLSRGPSPCADLKTALL